MKDHYIIKQIENKLNIDLPLLDTIPDWDTPNGYYTEGDDVVSLKLCGLKIDQFPTEILQFSHLSLLYMWGNSIATIPNLSKLKELSTLDLSANFLTDISFLEGAAKLNNLILSGNELEILPELTGLTNLENLEIAENKLRDIRGLQNLKSLKSLILSENNLEDLSALENLGELIELDISDNPHIDITNIKYLTNLELLRSTGNELIDISPLKHLTKLRKLDLWTNQINNISILSNLTNLEELDLWSNNITEISALSNLRKLKSLDLSTNPIEDLVALSKLSSLRQLVMTNAHICEIQEISALTSLTHLLLNGNKISNIAPLKRLVNLEELALGFNKIQDLPAFDELKKLRILNLRDNDLVEICNLGCLDSIETLNLSNNNIVEISSLTDLKKLTAVDLSFNNIEDISSLQYLKDLVRLNLRNNRIESLPEWLIQSEMENNVSLASPYERYNQFHNEILTVGFNIQENPIINVPLEFLNQDKIAIRDYFKSLEDGFEPINEIKVIILGEGAAGKTSLMQYLQGKKYIKGQPQTHGINLEECTGATGVTMKIWDFGGQDIMHHTHQFFLTQKSVYILVLNARENTDTEKWLKLIQVFGGDSPIIIVTNKIDENPSDHENIKYLNTKYPNIQNRYARISCEKGLGLEHFKTILTDTIKDLLHVRTFWGNNWLGVKRELEEMRSGESLKDYIHFDRYEEICDKHNVSKSHRETLINWLHQLGVITYFPDSNLSETNVINPSWLTEAFYKIINSKAVAKNFGRFNLSHLSNILNKSKYPPYKYSYLIGLMTKFELCYKIDDENFLIPDLLNKEEPNFSFDIKSSLKFKIKYSNLLPKAVLPKFMVRRNSEIKNDIKWRTGLLICDQYFESEALVRVDEDDKEISIFVAGEQKRGYLASIISNLNNINSLYEGLEHDKLVPCVCSTCINLEKPHYFKYEVLRKLRSKGKRTYTCETSADDVLINELLGVLITTEELEKNVQEWVGKGAFQAKKYIEEGSIDDFITVIKSLFSSVSYLLFDKSEKAYHTPLFILLRSLFSSDARADEIQAKGRTDIIINTSNFLYIFELKLDGTVDDAIKQIHTNRYYEPYLLEKKKIILVGINFSSKERNITNYKTEILTKASKA